MIESKHTAVLAIDGGGTRCRFAHHADNKTVFAEAGAANVSSDFDAAVRTIRTGVSALADLTNKTVDQISAIPAFVGLAGVTGPRIIERLEVSLPFASVRYADDRPAALRGALGQRDGVIAHCGTGSFFASQMDGKMQFSGGWGPVLGDEASAQWLGRRLLWAVLRSVDGFWAETPLSKAVLDRLEDAPGIVRFAGGAGPADLGALAPMVTEAALASDPLAIQLMSDAAMEVSTALQQLGWKPGLAICLTGGVAPHYSSYLPKDMQGDIRPPEAEPIHGAISLAHEFGRELIS